jgi:hypothetical protein
MHGDVDFAAQHRFLDLLDEEPLAADHRQRDIEDLVTLGLDLGQGDLNFGVALFQFAFDPVGLPQGQLARPGADPQLFFGHRYQSLL